MGFRFCRVCICRDVAGCVVIYAPQMGSNPGPWLSSKTMSGRFSFFIVCFDFFYWVSMALIDQNRFVNSHELEKISLSIKNGRLISISKYFSSS